MTLKILTNMLNMISPNNGLQTQPLSGTEK